MSYPIVPVLADPLPYGAPLSGRQADARPPADQKAPVVSAREGQAETLDLRLADLGLVVTRDGGIPLVCHASP
jgi:hypothetical protein